MNDMHENLDKKLNQTTQVLQKSMTDFLAQMSNLQSSVATELESNSIKSDRSGMDNSAGSKRPASQDDTDFSTPEKGKICDRRKSPRISPLSKPKSNKGIDLTDDSSTVSILKPGEGQSSSGKT